MTTLYVTTEGAVVRSRDERLSITKQRETLADVPLHHLEAVVVIGPVTVTPAAMRALAERRIDLCFGDWSGRFFARLTPPDTPHVALRRAQYRALDDGPVRLELARGMVLGKLYNQRATLLRARRAREAPEPRTARLTDAIKALRRAARGARMAETLDELRGHEGEGASAYFGAFGEMLLNPDFSFAKRTRRPPVDPVNAMLSFGYAMLARDAVAAAGFVGLDPYAGFLHGGRYNQPSLGLDLMEEFRPVLVDSVVLTLINRRQVSAEDFEKALGGAVLMSDPARRTLLRGYEERKRTEIQHPVTGKTSPLGRVLELQARIVGKVLMGELERYIPFTPK